MRMGERLDDELVDLPEDDGLVEVTLKSAYYISFDQPLNRDSLNLFELSGRFRYVTCASVAVELSQSLLNQLSDALPQLVDFLSSKILQ